MSTARVECPRIFGVALPSVRIHNDRDGSRPETIDPEVEMWSRAATGVPRGRDLLPLSHMLSKLNADLAQVEIGRPESFACRRQMLYDYVIASGLTVQERTEERGLHACRHHHAAGCSQDGRAG
jgi:hypothetical protein